MSDELRISVKMLEDLGARAGGIENFENAFAEPLKLHGGVLWPTVLARYLQEDDEDYISDLDWFALACAEPEKISWQDRLRIVFSPPNMHNPAWLIDAITRHATHTPACVVGATWEARVALARTAAMLVPIAHNTVTEGFAPLRYLVERCPALGEGDTLAARLALIPPQYHARAIRIMPAGVDGCSWETRLARAFTDADRWDIVTLNDPSVTLAQRLAALPGGARHPNAAQLIAELPANTPGASWDERLALCTTPDTRDCLALNCPDGVEGATWENRVKAASPYCRRWGLVSCARKYNGEEVTWAMRVAALPSADARVAFACHAYTLIPDATWEARLALCKTREARIRLACTLSPGVPGSTKSARMAIVPAARKEECEARIDALFAEYGEIK